MIQVLSLVFKQFISFLGILILGKAIFCIYHSQKFFALNFTDQSGIFSQGIKLDISMASYLHLISLKNLFRFKK
jgi:hypothetical protein